jgi:hypothetical protein
MIDIKKFESYYIWDIEEFNDLGSFSSRIHYCEKNLQRISSGSSRIVYKIDDTKVIKIAKNRKGLAQNNVEINCSNDYMWDGIITEIYNYDDGGLWVEVEMAFKTTKRQFKDIIGVSFDDYTRAIHFIKYGSGKPDYMDMMWENEFVYTIFDLIGNYDLPIGDLCRISTYGRVHRGNEDFIVLVDYGLSAEVYDKFYKN